MNKRIEFLNANADTNAFVGIDYEYEKIKIYFPIGYQIPTDSNLCKISILELIEAINITKITLFDSNYGIISGEYDEIPINSYIWLIKDYLNNGLYYDIEKTFKSNINGKINWKRTLKTKLYSSKQNVVYLNPVIEKNCKEKNDLTEIETFCLKESIEKIGWLFGNVSFPEILTNEKTTDYYLNILEYELANSFNDRKKSLINHLIRIVTQKSNTVGYDNKKYGTYSFNIAWEKIVDKVFGNLKSKEFFPYGRYKFIYDKEIKTHDMYPDTLLKYNNDLYILDSKYYKFGISENYLPNSLPSTESIEKQIAYAKYANSKKNKSKYKYQNVYNAFIIPYNKKKNRFGKKEAISYVGYAESGNYVGKYLYEKIAIILVDTKYLMDCYFKREQNDLKLLVEAIQNIKYIENK